MSLLLALFGDFLPDPWWIHHNLHMNVGLDMDRLIYIELAFHITLLACGVVLAISLMRLAGRAASRPAE